MRVSELRQALYPRLYTKLREKGITSLEVNLKTEPSKGGQPQGSDIQLSECDSADSDSYVNYDQMPRTG